MDTREIINYWKETLCGGDYCRGVPAADKSSDVTVKHDCGKAIEKVSAYTDKERLREFICLYSLYHTLYCFTGEKRAGLLVECKDEPAVLVHSLDGSSKVKAEISSIYNDYKKLYVMSQYNRQQISKFLTDEEKSCLEGKGHLAFVYGKELTDRSGFSVNNGIVTFCGKCDRAYMESFLKSFSTVAENVVEALKNDGSCSSIEVIDVEERSRILSHSCGRITERDADATVFGAFRKCAEAAPDKQALVCGGERMTYGELYRNVRNIAAQLGDNGISRGSRVAVMCENGCMTIASVMAVWAVGAVYVPLTPQLSDDRIKHILDTSEAELVIVQSGRKYDNADIAKLVVGRSDNCTADETDVIVSEDMHIIFTSGTTGKPKAAVIGREGFINLCEWYIDEFEFNSSSKSLLLTNYSFDASVKNIAVPLMTGGELHIVPTSLYDISTIGDIIRDSGITHINCVPSLFVQLLESEEKTGYKGLESLRAVILGGESFPVGKIKKWLSDTDTACRVSNVYGPTEATDLATFYNISAEDLENENVPIGYPVPNKRVYILGGGSRLLPAGVVGNICISGTGVIKSYLGAGTGAEKFSSDPYAEGMTLYNTGDLGRLNADGVTEYIGRADNQVKINGQRVELEEIESAALLCGGITQCAAVIKENGAGKELILYYTSKSGVPVERRDLEAVMRKKLSASVCPNRYIRMDKLPQNSSGKTDRKALAAMKDTGARERNIVEPENELERGIRDIWIRILGRKDISVTEPFFEAGGNSLLLNKLKAELDKLIRNSMSVMDFFEYPTIRMIANNIGNEELL